MTRRVGTVLVPLHINPIVDTQTSIGQREMIRDIDRGPDSEETEGAFVYATYATTALGDLVSSQKVPAQASPYDKES